MPVMIKRVQISWKNNIFNIMTVVVLMFTCIVLKSAHAIQPTTTILVAAADARGPSGSAGLFPNYITQKIYDVLVYDGYEVVGTDQLEHVRVFASDQSQRRNLLSVARSMIRPPIDLIVLHKLKIDIRRTPKGPVGRFELEGEILEVASGRRVFRIVMGAPRTFSFPVRCDRRCMQSYLKPHLEQQTNVFADDLRYELERRIPYIKTNLVIQNDTIPGICGMRRGWEITLSGFNLALLNHIESYLVAFSCYIAHRPTATQPGQNVYWYESGISPAHFQRNLQRMSEDLGIEVSLTGQGGHYTMTYVSDLLLGRQTDIGDGW